MFSANILKYCCGVFPVQSIYFLAPWYYEASMAHCLCESYLDTADPEHLYNRLNRKEARQYYSTLARCRFS